MTNENLLLPTKIIKSKRKSISLIIKNNGDFIVRMPINAKMKDVESFIIKKSDWIIKKRIEQNNNIFKPLSFDKIEKITLLSKEYDICYHDLSKVKIEDNLLFLPKENAKEKLIKHLKKMAKQHITERIRLIAELFNFSYESISINSARTCWGSCGSNNKLHFTYKLVLCPLDVIDYIVLHELCHTKVKNHSTKFWQLVEHCMPNYKIQEKWLKKNRGIINII